MQEKKREPFWKKLLNEFEIYLGAFIFIFMTALLFIQVVTRFLLSYSFTWTEEVATILFVWMTYLGIAAAVLRRKHLKIDAFVDAMPFKVKRTLLIISDVIFILFCFYIMFPLMDIVQNYASRGAGTPILDIPNAVAYGMLPLCFALTAIRLVQEIWRLAHEKEGELGVSKHTIDMDALEREAAELKAQREKEGGI